MPPRGSSCARDPLAQRLFRHKIRTRDLRGGKAADQAQRERDASVHPEHGMARGEDEPQHVIIDHLIQRLLQSVSKPLLLPLQLARQSSMLLYEHAAAPQRIDRAPLRRGHQPCPGIVRDAFLGPNFEGTHKRILSQLLGYADIVGDASNRGDELRVDSIFHTASTVLWTSLIRMRLPGQLLEPFRRLLNVVGKVRHLVNLADFDLLGVRHGCPLCPFDGLFA